MSGGDVDILISNLQILSGLYTEREREVAK
jgi:hypothetical protein